MRTLIGILGLLCPAPSLVREVIGRFRSLACLFAPNCIFCQHFEGSLGIGRRLFCPACSSASSRGQLAYRHGRISRRYCCVVSVGIFGAAGGYVAPVENLLNGVDNFFWRSQGEPFRYRRLLNGLTLGHWVRAEEPLSVEVDHVIRFFGAHQTSVSQATADRYSHRLSGREARDVHRPAELAPEELGQRAMPVVGTIGPGEEAASMSTNQFCRAGRP